MGLLLLCPHCRNRMPLSSRGCRTCGADLRDLPSEDRCYIFDEPEEIEIGHEVQEMLPLTLATGVAGGEAGLPEARLADADPAGRKKVSLCEALDRILHKGAVVYGEVMISVADIDLVYLGLQVILSSMETARGFRPVRVEDQFRPNFLDNRAS